MKPTRTTRGGRSATAPLEERVEPGEGHGHALGALDLRHALGAERGDGERHGDAVVAVRAHAGPAQPRSALDDEAVGQLPHARPEGGEALDERPDAVALL